MLVLCGVVLVKLPDAAQLVNETKKSEKCEVNLSHAW